MEKMVESFAVFAKIVLYITICFNKFFKGNVKKNVNRERYRLWSKKKKQLFTINFCMRLKLF